jgi:hypothetical protein
MEIAAASIRTRPLSLARVRTSRWALGAIIVVAAAVHLAVALAQAVPLYFPDEYIYASLARSIAQTGHPLVHGSAAHFPALLEPLLAAPFWLTNNVELAYRLTDALNAVAGAVAAVPVYLLVRKLGLSTRFAVAAAALTAFRSSLFFGAFVLADPIAQPFALAALYLGVCVLARPTTRNQLGFLAAAGLATFARVEYLPLPLVLLVGALVLERGRVAGVVRKLRLSLLVLAGFCGAALAVRSPGAWLGYYGGVLHLSFGPHALAHWYTSDVLLFSLGSGIVIVPAALVAIGHSLQGRQPMERRAFAVVALGSALVVFAESSLYSTNGSQTYEGRYLMALSPLLLPAFGVYRQLGCPRPRLVALLSMLLLVGLVGLRPFDFTSGQHKFESPLLISLSRLRDLLGPGGSTAALSVAIVALCLGAAAAAARRRAVVPAALAVTACVSVLITSGAFSVDLANAGNVKRTLFPAGLRWIDESHLRNVALVDLPGTPRDPALSQLFWNTSVTSIVRLPGAAPIDSFPSTALMVGRDGSLLADGQPLRRPLLVDENDDVLLLRGARNVARAGRFSLWRPAPRPRLGLLLIGRYGDGWLAPGGALLAWADAPHERVVVRLSQPRYAPSVTLRFATDRRRWSETIRSGGTATLALCVSPDRPTELVFRGGVAGYDGTGRAVSVRATPALGRGC